MSHCCISFGAPYYLPDDKDNAPIVSCPPNTFTEPEPPTNVVGPGEDAVSVNRQDYTSFNCICIKTGLF